MLSNPSGQVGYAPVGAPVLLDGAALLPRPDHLNRLAHAKTSHHNMRMLSIASIAGAGACVIAGIFLFEISTAGAVILLAVALMLTCVSVYGYCREHDWETHLVAPSIPGNFLVVPEITEIRDVLECSTPLFNNIANIVIGYAMPDFSLAIISPRSISPDKVDEVRLAIRFALSSAWCDPAIKRQIFLNFSGPDNSWEWDIDHAVPEESWLLDDILNEIRMTDGQIILDHMDFSGLTLTHLDLSGASAVSARFSKTRFSEMQWTDGEFSGAQFHDCSINCCIFNRSNFRDVYFYNSRIVCSGFGEVDLRGSVFVKATFTFVCANGLLTDNQDLTTGIWHAPFSLQSHDGARWLRAILFNFPLPGNFSTIYNETFGEFAAADPLVLLSRRID